MAGYGRLLSNTYKYSMTSMTVLLYSFS